MESSLVTAASAVTRQVASELEQELFRDFEKKIEWLQDELRRMQCFLKDSVVELDQQRVHRIGEVRKLAYDAEDLISKFLIAGESKSKNGICQVIYKCKQWNDKRKITEEVEVIKNKLLQINQTQNPSFSNVNQASLQRTPSYNLTEASDIVGLDNETQKLLRQLNDKDMKQTSVVPILGMGGIGKSTLARKILHHPEVTSKFEVRAWVTVTSMHQLDYRDVQVMILPSTSPTEGQQTEEQELEKLCESLCEKRYLVVLDDVGSPPPQLMWVNHLLEAFPDVGNGSRIIITTRMNDLTVYLGTHSSTPLAMNHLDDQKSWELFCKKALFDNKDGVLQDLGRKMVRRCGGLPLSIVTVGGKLKEKKRHEWEKLYKEGTGTLPDEVRKALEPSYNELTPELQDCFLRLGFFPKNYTIPARKLTQLWIAEGLVSDQGEGLEAAAYSHLDLLFERNMIQSVETSPEGSIKACRIDSSLHELSILKAKGINFLEVHNADKFSPSLHNRHRAVHHSMHEYFESEDPSSNLRSLVFVVSNGSITLPQIKYICKRFKLLKLLHLEGMIVGRLPREIGNLRNLRYLNLRNTSIDKLQPSMRNLKELLILDIRDNMSITGLHVIKDMTNLQYLYLPGYYEGLDLDGLNQLRVLKWVKLASTESLESLVQLTTLQMQLESQFSLDDLLKSAAENLKKLESLHLYPSIEIPSLDTENFKLLESLTKLYIKGGVRQLPSTEKFPPNLMQLTLDGSGLIPFPLDELGKLPKLSILRLRNLYIKDEKLSFSSAGFLRLKYLELLNLWNLKDLELQGEGALQRLRHLKISNCTALKSLPKKMDKLTKLSELHIDKMREAFEQKIQEKGEDHKIVQHVRFIKYTNTLRNHEAALVEDGDSSNEKELDKVKMKEELKFHENVPPSQFQQQQCHSRQNPSPNSLEVLKDRFKSVSARLGDSMVELISLACEANQQYPGPDGLEAGLPQIIANACRTLSDSKQSQPNPVSSQSEELDKEPSASMLDNNDSVESTIVEDQSAEQQTPSHIGSKKYEADVLEKDEQIRATNIIFPWLQKYCYFLGVEGAQEDDKFVVDYVIEIGKDRLMLFLEEHSHITRIEFETSGDDTVIYNSIMNLWAKEFNYVENKNRKPHTHKRIFLTTIGDQFRELVEEVPGRDAGKISRVSWMLESNADSGYTEPEVIKSCRGRPPARECGQKRTSVPNSMSMNIETVNYNEYLESYLDVEPDGNCGFRVVALWYMDNQEEWKRIRAEVANELTTKFDHYSKFYTRVADAIARIEWFDGHCNRNHWMEVIDDLFPIANLYNAAVILFEVDNSDKKNLSLSPWATILPTYASEVTRPASELYIGYIARKSHYIHLKMNKDCPIPPIPDIWSEWCDSSVRGWDEQYDSRIRVQK